MGSYQIWPYHVTQAENLSFPYIKSYCPLNFRKSHQISWFCYIPNGSYKEDNLKEGRICPPPPMWNRVKPLLVWRIAHSRNNNKIDYSSFASLSIAPLPQNGWTTTVDDLLYCIHHFENSLKDFDCCCQQFVSLCHSLSKRIRRKKKIKYIFFFKPGVLNVRYRSLFVNNLW